MRSMILLSLFSDGITLVRIVAYLVIDITISKINDLLPRYIMLFTPDRRYHLSVQM